MPVSFTSQQKPTSNDDGTRSPANKSTGFRASTDGSVAPDEFEADLEGEEPTTWEFENLPRVSAEIPWQAYTIALVELCERFGYYGVTILLQNFIQMPLPEGSTTGKNPSPAGHAGALGLGQRTATAITTFMTFWSYITTVVGALIADQYLGRYTTAMWSIWLALIGHIIIVIAALPSIIANGTAPAPLMIGIIILGLGSGGFKATIAPLIAEQYRQSRHRVIIDPYTNERVVRDPGITIQRIYMYFYWVINVGSLAGPLAMTYVEKYVGYWVAFLLPTVLFCLCPAILWFCRDKYHVTPPTGSVLPNALKLWFLAQKGKWSWNLAKTRKNFTSAAFWGDVKPRKLEREGTKPTWMVFDNAWVRQVARGFRACAVFSWIPLYMVSYNQMNNNLISQAATLDHGRTPNDLIQNIDPIALIVLIPIFDSFVYPALRKFNIRFTPIKRIATGFGFAAFSSTLAAVVQYYVYKKGPCGHYMNNCSMHPAPISVWVQIPIFVFYAVSEILTLISVLEYAFTKAPQNMRSLMMSYFCFTNALAAVLGEAMVGLSNDPLLVWNYVTAAAIAAIGGVGFWMHLRPTDGQEDQLNALPRSQYTGKKRE